jgi:hypothetical protein
MLLGGRGGMSSVEKCRSSGKLRHKTYEEAVKALSEMPSGSVYFCHICRGFHISRRTYWQKRRGKGKSKRGSVRRPS